MACFVFCLNVLVGLSPDLQSMEQIRRIMRPTDVPDQGWWCGCDQTGSGCGLIRHESGRYRYDSFMYITDLYKNYALKRFASTNLKNHVERLFVVVVLFN